MSSDLAKAQQEFDTCEPGSCEALRSLNRLIEMKSREHTERIRQERRSRSRRRSSRGTTATDGLTAPAATESEQLAIDI